MYCKYCKKEVSQYSVHNCPQKGRLDPDDDNSFLISALIGFGTDSAIAGTLLGGDPIGGIVGDLLDGDLFD